MSLPRVLCKRPAHALASTLLASLLAACGGGNSTSDTEGRATAMAASPTTPAGGTAASAGSKVTVPRIAEALPVPRNAADVGTVRKLADDATLTVTGVTNTPTPSGVSRYTRGGRIIYVDSRYGDDSYDGLASSIAGTSGPFRTLARLARAGLTAGDTVRLACGSEFNEPLIVPVSGTTDKRIVIAAADGCAVPPAIDGSEAILPMSWVRHSGNVFRAPLANAPAQLSQAAPIANWTEAHHPNRGYLASDPKSLYLAAAPGSDWAASGTERLATSLATGPDLVLPPGAQIGAGTKVVVRMYPWKIQERTAATFNSLKKLVFTEPMWYPIGTGWGYYLKGHQWMVDSEGEWWWDPVGKQVYAYMPGGVPPTAHVRATVQALGIDLRGRSFVTVQGINLRRVVQGADLRDSNGVELRNIRMDDIADIGVDATTSRDGVIDACAITRTGADAISGWRHDFGPSENLTVRNSVIRDAGVTMVEETQVSLPKGSYAAIYGGVRSTITGNTVVNSGYIGIQGMPNSTISGNFVYGACSVMDDCAAIYVQYAGNNSIIRNNAVVHTRQTLAGKPPEYRYSQAQGIYLDESASGVLIENNTVIDADNGVHLHVASNNIVRGNRLFGNRRAQMWMQVTRNNENPAGDLYGNVVTGNQIAAMDTTSVGIRLDTMYPSTSLFASFDGNRYFDRNAPIAVQVSTSNGTRDYTFAQWQSATASDLPTVRDPSGVATSSTGYATMTVTGGNMVPNAQLQTNASGWVPWSATGAAQIFRESCPAGMCLRYVGGLPAQVSSHEFSIVKDQWYRVSVDISAEADGQLVDIVVRRGGGLNNNGFDSVSDRAFTVAASKAWKRYSRVFKAITTVNYRDALTGDNGARVDVVPSASTVSFANLELVPITVDSTANVSSVLLNANAAEQPMACPQAGLQPAMCAMYRRLSDDQPVTWPAMIGGFDSSLVYTVQATLRDSDRDGIPDSQDQCPGTPAGAEVDGKGCPLVLR